MKLVAFALLFVTVAVVVVTLCDAQGVAGRCGPCKRTESCVRQSDGRYRCSARRLTSSYTRPTFDLRQKPGDRVAVNVPGGSRGRVSVLLQGLRRNTQQ